MADNNNVLLNNLAALSQPENFQRYVLGTKSNGQPRALYDVVKDYTKHGKKGDKKRHKNNNGNGYQLILTAKKHKKHKKGKKGKKGKKYDNYWHI